MSEKVRIRAALELGNNKSKESKEQLIRNLSTLNSFVRDAVVESLVNIKDVDFLCKKIHNEHRYVRRGIVQALGRIGGNKASKQIIESLYDKEWGVRMYAAEALGNIGKPEFAKFLNQLLKDEHQWPREEAMKSLKKLN